MDIFYQVFLLLYFEKNTGEFNYLVGKTELGRIKIFAGVANSWSLVSKKKGWQNILLHIQFALSSWKKHPNHQMCG